MPNQSNFTPEQIAEILELFFENMAHRQYIGARYIPIFGRKGEESIVWDGGVAPYEALTVVIYQGNSYTSRQYVPAGIDITNNEFWAETGNYSAQIEQYRQEVLAFDDRITTNANGVSQNAEDIDDLETATTGALSAINANNWVTTPRINDGAVTTPKIAGSAITLAKLSNEVQQKLALAGSPNIFEYVHKTSLAFGDSNMWGQAYTSINIYQRICNYLGCSYNNFALSGAGWENVLNIDNVYTQIVNESTVVPTDVRLICIMAGINDFHYGSGNISTFQSAVNNALNAALNKYKNALIVVMFDSGSQMPSPTMLLYQLALARIAQAKSRCIYIPLADLAQATNLWYNQNHYNDTGAEFVAGRVKTLLYGGDIAAPQPRYTGQAFTATDPTSTGFYGITTYTNTTIDPVNFTRTDDFGFNIDTSFGNTLGLTNFSRNDPIFDLPIVCPRGNYANSSTCFPLSFIVSSGGAITSVDLPIRFVQHQYSKSGDTDPAAGVIARFDIAIAPYQSHLASYHDTFVSTAGSWL